MTFSQELDRLSLHFVKISLQIANCREENPSRRAPDVVLGEAELDTDAIAQLRVRSRSCPLREAASAPKQRGYRRRGAAVSVPPRG